MKTQILMAFLLTWLCVDISVADDDEKGSEDINKNKFKVDISGLSVKITCPSEGKNLKNNDKVLSSEGEHTFESFEANNNGVFDCDNKLLYLMAYVCENCTEVSLLMAAGILIADSLLTLGVSLLIYFGCKKKSVRSSEITPGGRNRGNKERPPPVPHPDYEPIRKGKQDVYDGLNKNYK